MNRNELIDLCKKGNEQALNLLYKTYADKMMKICFHYVSDKQVAQDLLHDGFIIIFTSISTLRSPERLEGWMGTIMKNISLRYLNQCNSIKAIPLEEIKEDEEPVDALLSNDFPAHETMLEMIESLPEGYCKVFKLAVLEGLSHKEISLLLNIAPHSSSSQLSRAKTMLRKLIFQYRMMVVLLIVSFLLSLGIWLNTPKNTLPPVETVVSEQKEERQKPEKETLQDSVKPVLYPACKTEYAHSKPIESVVEEEFIPKDTVADVKDSIKSVTPPAGGNRNVAKQGSVYNPSPSKLLLDKKEKWALSLTYSGGEKQTDIGYSTSPGDASSGNPQEVKEKVHHHIPITLSLSLYKNINDRWGIETGIQYTHLRSDFTSLEDSYSIRKQRVNYLGIPVKGTFRIWNNSKVRIYTSAGITLDIPVKATSEEVLTKDGHVTSRQERTLHPSLQWSTGVGIGVQYHITPNIGIYAEPNLNYYFNNGNHLNTIRKEKPFNVTLPIGIRLSW